MTNATPNKPLLEPGIKDMLQSLKSEIFRSMNCVKIGKIQSFDMTKKTAQVQILFKRVVPDPASETGESTLDYPVLVDCPVFTLQGGGGAIQFPIAAGDQCILLFSDRNIDAWFQNGSAAAPFDSRCHDLSDAICLVGLNSLASTLPAYQANKLVLSYSGAEIDIASGAITFKSATSNSEIDMSAGAAAIKNGSGGQVAINSSSIITIGNNVTTLKTILNGLIDVLTATLVQGPSNYPLTAATITALNLYKVQIATLLL